MAPRRHPWLGIGLIALGVGVAVSAVLGPFVLAVIDYRTSPTSLNQIVGADAAGLLLVAPFSVLVGVLVLRGRRGTALLGLPPAVYAAYTYPQLVVGNEYLDRPGNVEWFFPLLVGVFVLAVAVAGAAWAAAAEEPLPAVSHDADRFAGSLLLAVATFVVLGLHLPTYLDALSDTPTTLGYLSSPTAFWLVKFMDLGIVVPAAVVVGTGMLAGRSWARRPMHAVIGGYALLGTSVAAMAIVMYAEGDSDSSPVQVVSTTAIALSLLGISALLYRPYLRPPGTSITPTAGQPTSDHLSRSSR